MCGAELWLRLSSSIQLSNYNTQYPVKMAMYCGLLGMVGVSIMPLCVMAGSVLVVDAALATSVSMSLLVGIAYMAPSEQFLMWGGALSMNSIASNESTAWTVNRLLRWAAAFLVVRK